MNLQSKLGPALWGGLFIGVVSGVPVLNLINCACCAGVMGGGVLAVYMFRRQQTEDQVVTMSEGALLGLMAGVIGAVIAAILGGLFGAMSTDFMQAISRYVEDPEIRDAIDEFRRTGMQGGMMAVGLMMALIVNSVFGLVGGLIGVSLFGKGRMV